MVDISFPIVFLQWIILRFFARLLKQDSKESGYSTMLDFTGTDNSSSLDEHWGGARPKIRSALLDVSTAEVYHDFATDNSYKFISQKLKTRGSI